MRKGNRQRWFVGLLTLGTCGVLASSSLGTPFTPDPNKPIPGVHCPAGTNQITDTVSRLDGRCLISLQTWIDIGGEPGVPPKVVIVDPTPIQIPVPIDPVKIKDLNPDLGDPDGPTPDLGPILDKCKNDPACAPGPGDIPPSDDPGGSDVVVTDPTGDDGTKTIGYHCDPHTYTSDDLVSIQTVIPLDSHGDPTDPIEAWVLNSQFPLSALPAGDATADPPLPSFLSTKTGTDSTTKLPYWLDDPRADNSAYVNPSLQGCALLQDTAPPVAPQNPVSALPETPASGALTVSWDALEQNDANNGGDQITSYEVTSIPGDKTCTIAPPSTTCTVKGLTDGTLYTFKVRAINGVGNGPWSAITDPSLAPQLPLPARKHNARAAPAWKVAVASVASAQERVFESLKAPAQSGHLAAAKKKPKVTVPGLPAGVKVIQRIPAPGTYPSNGSVTVTWTAPKSNGGAPITGYKVVAAQRTHANMVCSTSVPVRTCSFDGINKTTGNPATFLVYAKNSKGFSAPLKTPVFKFVVLCSENTGQAKCAFGIKIKVMNRLTGSSGGVKTRIKCGLTPFVLAARAYIANPKYPANPDAPPKLVLGDAVGPVCRAVLTNTATPKLTKAQTKLKKKGYTVFAIKLMGLPAKGSREHPVPLPYGAARLETPFAIAKNGTDDKKKQTLIADSKGVIVWIGVVKKAGYYGFAARWPFYKSIKTYFRIPKSKAKK